MNSIVLKVLSLFPQVANAIKILQWLLAETGWQRDVALWLEKEQEWYFQLAAAAWGTLAVPTPVSVSDLKAILLETTK